jgi:hypothetical protein
MLQALNNKAQSTSPSRRFTASQKSNEILGHPKSGKTAELLKRAIQTAHQGQRTLVLSQNPVETSAIQEKAWIEQQKHHRKTPHNFPLTVFYSHILLEEIVKRLFPQLGFFTQPLWIHADNTHSFSLEQALKQNQITLSLAAHLLTRPQGPTDSHLEKAGLKFAFIFCDDSTLQPGYIHDLLPKLLRPQGTLTHVYLRSDPQQIYFLRTDPSAYKKHTLSIQYSSSTLGPSIKPPRDPNTGLWVLTALKKILLNQYEFAYGSSKIKPLDIAIGLPLGDKKNHHFELNHPWLETKRWRRYLLDHQQRLSLPNSQSATVEIAPIGFHPAAGSSILTRELRTPNKQGHPNRFSKQRAQIFCQPYFNLYGHYYDWLLLPYFDQNFLPKTEHRQLHFLWFLASRARRTLCYSPSPSNLPAWLTDPHHPTRRALEKSIKIEIKN